MAIGVGAVILAAAIITVVCIISCRKRGSENQSNSEQPAREQGHQLETPSSIQTVHKISDYQQPEENSATNDHYATISDYYNTN